MKNFKFICKILILGCIAVIFQTGNAYAIDIREAKTKNLIGEKSDGYLGVVVSSADVEALVKEINQKRRDIYAATASKTKVSVASVEVLGGKRAIDETPAGEMINTGSGWKKK